MNLQKFKRQDSMVASKDSYVSIRPGKFIFNAAFVKQAGLESRSRVAVFLDPRERAIGFKFHNNEDDSDSYKMWSSANSVPRNVSAGGIMKAHRWIESVAGFHDADLRRFRPQYNQDDDMWLIRLCPAFENKVSSVSEIPSSTKGVYRYLLDDEVVYIGRGIVRSRANTSERADWDFDIIEYSVIEDTEEQGRWETFFLDKFVEENGKLPIYNKLSGKKQKSD